MKTDCMKALEKFYENYIRGLGVEKKKHGTDTKRNGIKEDKRG